MSKLLKAFLIVLAIWLIFVGVTQSAASLLRFNWFPRNINFGSDFGATATGTQRLENDTAGISAIRISTRNGSVRVESHSEDAIIIDATYRANAGTNSEAERRLETLATRLRTSGNTLHVEADFGTQTVNNQSIAYVVYMPEHLDVEVQTSNGTITTEGMSGELSLNTSNGTISITADEGPKAITARTSNGRIELTAAPTGGVYNLHTSNGRVTVALPEELGVKVQATTSNGSITLGYGTWSFAGGRIDNRNVSAEKGDGALDLTIRTSNGHIELIKR